MSSPPHPPDKRTMPEVSNPIAPRHLWTYLTLSQQTDCRQVLIMISQQLSLLSTDSLTTQEPTDESSSETHIQ